MLKEWRSSKYYRYCSIVIMIIKNLFTVGYNTIVYPRSGKLIHTNYLQKYNILTKNNMIQLITYITTATMSIP